MVRWSVGDGKGVLGRLARRRVMLSGKWTEATVEVNYVGCRIGEGTS